MNYSLFKPTYTGRGKNAGQQVHAKKWYVKFKDHTGLWHRWPAFNDERRSRSLGEYLDEITECRKCGEHPDEKLAKWLDSISSELRNKLTAIDVIGATDEELLSAHLEGKRDDAGTVIAPGYRQHLEARGDTADHVELTISRCRKAFAGAGLIHWTDVKKPGAAGRIATYLAGLRTKGEMQGKRLRRISGRTLNYYARCLRSFGHWMVESRRCASNPLTALHGVSNADVDRVETRALTVDEMREVLRTTVAEKVERFGIPAADRALLYRFAFETGMRPGSVRQLTVSNFDLDSDPPTVTAAAATMKRKKVHTQVIRAMTAALLADKFKTMLPAAPALRMPDKFTCAEMFRDDLAAARDKWIDQAKQDASEQERRQRSEFLSDQDHQGRRVNFYSLRHTHGTALGDAGIPQKDIQGSLHHTRSSTTDRYVHSDITSRSRAVNALPEIMPMALAMPATGTDGKSLYDCLSKACADVHSRAEHNRVPAIGNAVAASEGDGARTRNHRIDSPVL
jgi:integrase